ncbi:hypothetical protein [Acrocarpospora catenulata]|uniref:hypothetical protein n=1 Tax=Acrocarpospora catenulata TaxID=2836182 RepID=UPI001BD92B5D|nr:hypothetical protein [Acrocarpospora catenulata]
MTVVLDEAPLPLDMMGAGDPPLPPTGSISDAAGQGPLRIGLFGATSSGKSRLASELFGQLQPTVTAWPGPPEAMTGPLMPPPQPPGSTVVAAPDRPSGPHFFISYARSPAAIALDSAFISNLDSRILWIPRPGVVVVLLGLDRLSVSDHDWLSDIRNTFSRLLVQMSVPKTPFVFPHQRDGRPVWPPLELRENFSHRLVAPVVPPGDVHTLSRSQRRWIFCATIAAMGWAATANLVLSMQDVAAFANSLTGIDPWLTSTAAWIIAGKAFDRLYPDET